MGFWEFWEAAPGDWADRRCPRCERHSASLDGAKCACGFDFGGELLLADASSDRVLIVPKPIPRDGQVVGYACIVCNRKIVFDADGAPCEYCQAPAHTKCLPHVHAGDKAGPYR